MSQKNNQYGQPIGASLPEWSPRPAPKRVGMNGRTCRVEPLDTVRHGPDLFAAYRDDIPGWTYLFVGPFDGEETFLDWLKQAAATDDPLFFTIIDAATGQSIGMASYMRIDRSNGVIEVGHIHYAPTLKRSAAATESMYLMMKHAFEDLGYRRYEWKCDSLNAPSRAAAERLGFRFEGIFSQAVVYKGRNRDTAWYSVVDNEWPSLKARFERWLAPENFDGAGRQRLRLHEV